MLDLSIQSKLKLSNYEAWVVRQVIALLNGSDADLERRISLALERTASLDTVERLRAIRTELVGANAAAYQRMGYFLTNEMRALTVDAADGVAVNIEEALPIKFSATRPSADLLKSLVTENPLQGRLLGSLSADGVHSQIENLAGNRAAALLNELQIGMTQGESWGQMLTRVRGTAAGGYHDGVLETIGRRQAETLTRTAVQHFSEAARDIAIDTNADLFQGVMWVATLDKRTTQICQTRDGLVWTLDHIPKGHSLDWHSGPGRAHWNCRSTSIPVFKAVDDLSAAGIHAGDLDPDQRAAFDGPVPATTDYEEWLRNQSDATQADALESIQRAQEFRDGASLSDVWDMRFDRRQPVAPVRG